METQKPVNTHERILGVFSLAMINVAAVVSLRNLPVMAKQGMGSLFFYAVAAILFLIPTALVCAELATTYNEEGGLYAWVRRALGPKIALLGIWVSWLITVSFLPALLIFIATNVAYLYDPMLAQSNKFILGVVLTILWGATFVNCMGLRSSAMVSTIGVLFGTLLPGVFILFAGGYWALTQGVAFTDTSVVPSMQFSNLAFLVTVMLGFEGMEITAFHAREVANPQKNFPRAITLATGIVLLISVFGSLAIAAVVPSAEINLVAGVMQTFTVFLKAFGIEYMAKVVAFMLVLGSLAGLSAWLLGPSKGVFAARRDNFLPKILLGENSHGIPQHMLIFQAVICSLLTCALVLLPNVDSAYWVLNILAAIFAFLMYTLIFVSAIKLRRTDKSLTRPFRCGGNSKAAFNIIVGLGLTSCAVGLALSFTPPPEYASNLRDYTVFLVGSIVVTLLPVLYLIRRAQKA